jgi:hypothetical protein
MHATRIVPLRSGRPNTTNDARDPTVGEIRAAATGSAASSTTITDRRLSRDTNNGALHGTCRCANQLWLAGEEIRLT